MRGTTLPPTVVYIATALLTVFLPGQGNLTAVLPVFGRVLLTVLLT